MQEVIREKAASLLRDGTVTRVLAWKRGELGYDVTPAVFTSEDQLSELVYNGFCGANMSKYTVKLSHGEGKTAVFLKPCDTYSFNQLLCEHRIIRDNVYVVGIPCNGMLDEGKMKHLVPELLGAEEDGETVHLITYDDVLTTPRTELLLERCENCKSRRHVVYDELLGDDGEVLDSHRFDEVERLEAMTPDERYAFWQGELSRCIRCNACRNVCPACTCEKCVFDNPESGVENKAAANSFEEKLFHVIRAFHVAGRCTDCGECSRVCPQNIPLHLLNRKFISDINRLYGDYQAGETDNGRSPLVNFNKGDGEPCDFDKGGRE
jgi:hypothetical protein